MFNTIAYYLGYSAEEANDENGTGGAGAVVETQEPIMKTPADQFNITELCEEEGWGLVEKVLMQQEMDKGDCYSEFGERENLLIEHPSMFVPNTASASPHNDGNGDQQVPSLEGNEENRVVPVDRAAVSSSKRSQRRATRQQMKNKRRSSVTGAAMHGGKLQNKARNFNKMRLIVQQPRKHY